MKLTAVIAVVTIPMFFGCSQQEQQGTVVKTKLETNKEKLSYALGMELGTSLQHMKEEVDLPAFFKGIEDYVKENEPLMSQAERVEIKKVEMARIREEFKQKQETLKQERLKEGQAFLETNKQKAGVTTTASGLQYQILQEGDGPQPKPQDKVKVKYRGTFIDGKEFDSTEKHGGEPVTFQVNGVIAGWTEALQLMKAGSKYRLFIPPELAYGERGSGSSVPPNSTLIFDVELLEVLPSGK